MRRQNWTVDLIDEAIDAVTDKLAKLQNTDGADRARIAKLQQAAAALRADRVKYERRDAK